MPIVTAQHKQHKAYLIVLLTDFFPPNKLKVVFAMLKQMSTTSGVTVSV